MIKGRQILAARTLLRMPLRRLSTLTWLSPMLITQAENETASLTDQQAETVQHALEAAGIIFVEENGKGPGVRLRKQR